MSWDSLLFEINCCNLHTLIYTLIFLLGKNWNTIPSIEYNNSSCNGLAPNTLFSRHNCYTEEGEALILIYAFLGVWWPLLWRCMCPMEDQPLDNLLPNASIPGPWETSSLVRWWQGSNKSNTLRYRLDHHLSLSMCATQVISSIICKWDNANQIYIHHLMLPCILTINSPLYSSIALAKTPINFAIFLKFPTRSKKTGLLRRVPENWIIFSDMLRKK